jgi:hypothetical protein
VRALMVSAGKEEGVACVLCSELSPGRNACPVLRMAVALVSMTGAPAYQECDMRCADVIRLARLRCGHTSVVECA